MAPAILSMEAGDFAMLVAFLGFVAVGGFILAFVMLHRARLMENTPTALIRSAAQGYVELEGQARVMEGPPIVAPLTSSRCCWWRFKVEHRERNSNGKGYHWETVERDTSEELFELEDATGRCVVDPHGARVLPSRKWTWYGRTPRPQIGPQVGSGWMRAMGANYRYTEEYLEIDAPLYAIGYFRTQAGGTGLSPVDREVLDLLAKWKRDPRMMKLLDVNGDGKVDPREWEAARRMASDQVLRELVAEPPAPDVHILGRPPDSRPFVLSAIPQAQLVRRDRFGGGLALSLSIAAGALCTWALQVRGIL